MESCWFRQSKTVDSDDDMLHSVSEPVRRLVFQEKMHLETEYHGLRVTGWEDTYYD